MEIIFGMVGFVWEKMNFASKHFLDLLEEPISRGNAHDDGFQIRMSDCSTSAVLATSTTTGVTAL